MCCVYSFECIVVLLENNFFAVHVLYLVDFFSFHASASHSAFFPLNSLCNNKFQVNLMKFHSFTQYYPFRWFFGAKRIFYFFSWISLIPQLRFDCCSKIRNSTLTITQKHKSTVVLSTFLCLFSFLHSSTKLKRCAFDFCATKHAFAFF